MIVWIIDDDEHTRDSYATEFIERFPEVIVHTFDCLLDAQGERPDFIFIDLSAVEGRTLLCFNNNCYIGNLIHFVERFRSSFIVIMSALVSHAKDDMEDIQDRCGDNHIFVIDPLSSECLDRFLCTLYRWRIKKLCSMK